jgi:hypothetical protein
MFGRRLGCSPVTFPLAAPLASIRKQSLDLYVATAT